LLNGYLTVVHLLKTFLLVFGIAFVLVCAVQRQIMWCVICHRHFTQSPKSPPQPLSKCSCNTFTSAFVLGDAFRRHDHELRRYFSAKESKSRGKKERKKNPMKMKQNKKKKKWKGICMQLVTAGTCVLSQNGGVSPLTTIPGN